MALESSPEKPQHLRVVVGVVRDWVERCSWVWVEGQIISINRRSGNVHFLTLRDLHAEVSVSLTCNTATLDQAGPLTEGATVVCRIHPTVFTKNGSLSFSCDDLRPAGEGRLLAQLEQRKRQLHAEGLFDRTLKKRLPFLPRSIGLVTGQNSAAERDVLTNVQRRWPGARFTTQYALMQGPQCAEQVIDALRRLDANPGVDVIIIARGGGSLEDLLPFSDETLVREVFAARTPVISAIGHDPDTPILDLVADVRASTPTDAAKRVVPDVSEEARHIKEAQTRLRLAIVNKVRNEQQRLDQLRSRPALKDPLYAFQLKHSEVTNLKSRLNRALDNRIRTEQQSLTSELARVRAMSPKNTLERGYAILVDGEGVGVTTVGEVDVGDDLQVYLADGQLVVEVRETQPTSTAAAEPPSASKSQSGEK